MFDRLFFRGTCIQKLHGILYHAGLFLVVFLMCFQTAWSQLRDDDWPYDYLPQLIIFGVGVQPASWQKLQRMYFSLGIREGDRFIFTSTWLDLPNAALGHSIYQELERLDVRTFRRTIAHSKATYSLALYLQGRDDALNINFGKKIALAPYGEAERYFDKALIDMMDPVPWWRGQWHFQFGPGEQRIHYVHLRDPETGKTRLNPGAHHDLEAYMQYYNRHIADERDAPNYRPQRNHLSELLRPRPTVSPLKRDDNRYFAADPPNGGGGPGEPNAGETIPGTNGFYRDLGEARVGGVYLNGIVKIVSNFGEITGANYDAKQQRLIMVGNATVKLPPLIT